MNRTTLITLNVKLSFTNTRGPSSNFAYCEYFLGSNFPDILALWETDLDESIGSGNFSVRGYLPLIPKDSTTHMHGLIVYVKDNLPFSLHVSLENSPDTYLCCTTGFTSLNVLLLLLLSITFIFMHGF